MRFEFEPYRALTPAIIARRAARTLDLPASARLRFDAGTLYASGTASHSWIEEARIRAAQLEEVDSYDDAALVDEDVRALLDISDSLTRTPVSFPVASAELSDEPLDGFVGLVEEGLSYARDVGIPVAVVLRGYASPDGDPTKNVLLERSRTAVVRAALVSRGVPEAAVIEEEGGLAVPEVRAVLRILDWPTASPG